MINKQNSMNILYTDKQIKAAVKSIAKQIDIETKKSNPPVLVCVLTGGFMFFSDLVRALKTDCIVDFVRTKSYEGQNQSELKILKSIEVDINNKVVYLVDDILDTGITIDKLTEHLIPLNPKKIVPVTLFKRVGSNTTGLYGIEIQDGLWIHGYGLNDSNNLKRNLTNIYIE